MLKLTAFILDTLTITGALFFMAIIGTVKFIWKWGIEHGERR